MIKVIKNIIKKLVFNKTMANVMIKPLLKLHSLSYTLVGILSNIKHEGDHPKHKIMQYQNWFTKNVKEDWTVLDVGCKTGIMPNTMSYKVNYVYGIEIVCKHIEEAKKINQRDNIEFICADATSYDYSSSKSIDCITLSNVLEHIDERVEFLVDLSKNIKWKDKKRFLIRVPMIDREWIVLYKKDLGLEYRLDDTHFIEYTFEEFENELKEANITIKSSFIKFGEIYAVCEGK